jgi:nucleoside-diphosphate-sugar epimerase
VRAFVTGASGFIGGHLIARLVRDGWNVRVLAHQSRVAGQGTVETVSGDIRDFNLLKSALQDVDTLFHLASALGALQIGRKEFFDINAEGTRIVLRAALDAGVRRIVHFSSAGVLGHVQNGDVADENYPLAPRDAYDASKREGEQIALEAAARGQNVVVIRPGWVYGPGDRRTFKLIRSVARRRIVLVAGGKTLQTPVYIDDLMNGVLLCAKKGRAGEIFNVAGSEVLTIRRMIETIAGAVGAAPPRLSLPSGPMKAAAWSLGRLFLMFGKEAPLNPSRLAFFVHPKPLRIDKAVRDLGYAPAWNFSEGMAATVAWYRAGGWL